MRTSLSLRRTLILLAIAIPVFISVQLQAQFQQPSDAELKMTSVPKAPGAAAVYLNVEEIDNDQLHVQNFYIRIKVLAEEGKSLARVELPYGMGDYEFLVAGKWSRT